MYIKHLFTALTVSKYYGGRGKNYADVHNFNGFNENNY